MTTDTIRRLSKDELFAQVGTTFSVAVGDGVSVPALLTDIEDGPTVPGIEQFALLFTLPVEMPAVQRTYDMEHAALGAVQWFLVPVERNRQGLVMQAIFARRMDSASPEG